MKNKTNRGLVLVLSMCLPLLLTSACSIGTASANVFCFTIQDESGGALGQAEIALYSFLDEKIVATGRTGVSGQVVWQYTPSLPDHVHTYCGDYLALVTKAGYAPRLHLMTKLYVGSSADSGEAAAMLNSEVQVVTLFPASDDGTASGLSTGEQSMADYCRENGKLTTSSPIYILQDEDLAALRAAGTIPQTQSSASTYYYNREIPLGEFHTNAGCAISVSYTGDDVVRVEAAQRVGDSFLTGGSVCRPLGNALGSEAYTTTAAWGEQCTCSTQGTFVKQTVAYLADGKACAAELVQLHEIAGGLQWSAPVRCPDCGQSPSSVLAGACGIYIHLEPGSAQTHCGLIAGDLGLTAHVSELSLDLGAALSTSSNMEVKYAAAGELYLYDMDHSGRLYHITDAE